MRALFAFLLAFAWSANAAISTATKPHTIDSAATPKVSYVDDNDEALLDKINELIDTTNLHNSSGAVVGSLFSSTGDMRLLIDSDNNGTNRWMVTANGATDTLWRVLESGAWKGFGDGYVDGTLTVTGNQTGAKITLSDSILAATVDASGNIRAGGTFTAVGASTLAALSATTGGFSSTLAASGQSTLAGITLNGGSSGQGNIYTTATIGLGLQAKTGSSYDMSLMGTGGAGSYVLRVPTGTTTAEIPNAMNLSYLSSGRIPVVSTAGLITQDNLYWDAPNDRLGIGNSASSPAVDVDVVSSYVGGSTTIRVSNPDNTNTVSHARLVLTSGGASGGDAFTQYTVSGVTNWAAGVDNSDADAFVITPASTLGSATNGLRISTAGAVIMPGTLGVTGAATFSTNVTQSDGVTTISVTDNTANAVDIQQGSNNYINVNTTNSAENVALGNTTTNPSFSFLGSGTTTHSGPIAGTSATFSSTVSTGALTATSATLGGGESFVYGDTSFTLTATGMTTSPTGTAYATRIGNVVQINIPYVAGTSNSTGFRLTGFPASWCPTTSTTVSIPYGQNNGSSINASNGLFADLIAAGELVLYNAGSSSGWTSSGTKAIGSFGYAISITYNRQ